MAAELRPLPTFADDSTINCLADLVVKPKGKIVSAEKTSGLDNELTRQTVLKSDEKA